MRFHLIKAGVHVSSTSALKTIAADYLDRGFLLVEQILQDGDAWDEDTQTFKKIIRDIVLTPKEFLDLFTLDERKAIRRLGDTDENVEDFLDLLAKSTSVNMTHTDVKSGLNYFKNKGVLTLVRVNEIKGAV